MSAVKLDAKLAVSMGGQAMALTQSSVTVFPDKARVVIGTPMGEQTLVVNGDQGFMMAAGQVRDMPGSMLADQEKDMPRDLQYLVRYHDDPSIEAAAGAEVEIGGVTCRVVSVSFKDNETTVWIGPDGRVHKQAYQGKNPFTQAPAPSRH